MTRRSTVLAAFALAIATFFVPNPISAQLGGEFRMGMGMGGDAIASVQYSDGSDSNLKLGTYFSMAIGPVLELWSSGASAFELQGMIGFAGWSTGPENTDDRLSLTRFPADAMLMYTHTFPGTDKAFRIGGGMTYHMVRDVGGSGSLEGTSIPVESAAGPIGEASVIFGIANVGVRYTQMENTVGGATQPMGGSSFGLFFSLTTPRG